MRNAAVGVKWGVIISSMIVVIEAGLTYFFQGSFHFDLGWRWLTTLLFAIPEEVLFRGFLLQKLSSSLTFIKANLLASLLFVSIHLPIWLVQGGASLPKLIGNGATVFLVGYGLSLLVKRTNSLWSSTIVHTVYNLLIYLRAA
ncbi:lysostaphin resistance A-like protein [Brevibacillus fluminis]|uniref:CPBP family intramembrane glutamic endopeptidase n=1 Tax=Brevibacillus fluminis TaxID=511487 RepID=UPI003F88B0CB